MELVSYCCNANIDTDTLICMDCKEHAEAIDLDLIELTKLEIIEANYQMLQDKEITVEEFIEDLDDVINSCCSRYN